MKTSNAQPPFNFSCYLRQARNTMSSGSFTINVANTKHCKYSHNYKMEPRRCIDHLFTLKACKCITGTSSKECHSCPGMLNLFSQSRVWNGTALDHNLVLTLFLLLQIPKNQSFPNDHLHTHTTVGLVKHSQQGLQEESCLPS